MDAVTDYNKDVAQQWRQRIRLAAVGDWWWVAAFDGSSGGQRCFLLQWWARVFDGGSGIQCQLWWPTARQQGQIVICRHNNQIKTVVTVSGKSEHQHLAEALDISIWWWLEWTMTRQRPGEGKKDYCKYWVEAGDEQQCLMMSIFFINVNIKHYYFCNICPDLFCVNYRCTTSATNKY